MPEQPFKYAVGNRVYYEDMAGDYATVIEHIEVFPYYQQVYKIQFADESTMYTTDEALRLHQ